MGKGRTPCPASGNCHAAPNHTTAQLHANTSWDLALAGGHCKDGMGGVVAAIGDFFARKHPIMANMDLCGHKGFLE